MIIEESGLVCYLPFEEGKGNVTLDWSGNDNSGIIYGATWTNGKIGKALYFDGVDDYVSIADSPSLRGFYNFTATFWLRVPTKLSNPLNYLYRTNSIIVSVEPTTITHDFAVSMYDGTNWLAYSRTPANSFPVDKWTFCYIIWDGRYYWSGTIVDGIIYEGNKVAMTTWNQPSSAWLVGRGWNYGLGYVDEVRIYNRALSGQEIKAIYEATIHKFKPIRYLHLKTFPGCVLYLNFEEGSGTKVYDKSGFKNNGTIYGATWTNGKIGKALYFDGVDDYVEIGLPSFPFSSFTIAFWLYDYKHDPYRYERPIGLYKYDRTRMWDIYVTRFAPNTIYFEYYRPDGTVVSIPFESCPLNTWRFYVVTFDGKTYRTYVNGVLVNTKVDVAPRDLGEYYLYLGSVRALDSAWGIIDEVRIYNRALSGQEIKAIYYEGIKMHQINPLLEI